MACGGFHKPTNIHWTQKNTTTVGQYLLQLNATSLCLSLENENLEMTLCNEKKKEQLWEMTKWDK